MHECARTCSCLRAFSHSCIPAFLHSRVSCPSDLCRLRPLRPSRVVLRGVRAASRTPDVGASLCVLLAIDSPAHTARLRPLRRSTADLEGDERASGAMPPLPARQSPGGSRAGRRRVRRRVARDRARAQIRRTAIVGAAAGRPDAHPRRRHVERRRLGGSCAAPPVATA